VRPPGPPGGQSSGTRSISDQPASFIGLLRSKRFAPLFASQFLGVINDNLFKNALLITLTFREAATATSDSLAAASQFIYILPFFLMSAFSGDMADRHDKARLFARLKLLEMMIMSLALIGFLLESLPILLTALLLMGAQSTFFAPLKFGMATERLQVKELTAGTALLGGSTNVAILFGLAAGGFLAAMPGGGAYAAFAGIVIAFFGWASARMIDRRSAADSERKPNWILPLGVYRMLKGVYANAVIARLLIGIVWFWSLAALMLALVSFFVRDTLGGAEQDVVIMQIIFTVCVAVGAILANRVNRREPRFRAARFGAVGLILSPLLAAGVATFTDVDGAVLTSPQGLIVTASIALISISGGLFLVPMQTRLQLEAPDESRGRVFGAMNATNAAGAMAGSFIVSGALLIGATPLTILWIGAALNAVIGAALFPTFRRKPAAAD